MPTDASAGRGGDSATEATSLQTTDDLVFATQDLGRDQDPPSASRYQDQGFLVAPRAAAPQPADAGEAHPFVELEPAPQAVPIVNDGFVIAAPDGAVSSPPGGEGAGRRPFRLDASTAVPGQRLQTEEPPWVVRQPDPETASPAARQGWATRQQGTVDPSTHAAMLRLREEAVHVSWQSAWLAVTSTERKPRRTREQ